MDEIVVAIEGLENVVIASALLHAILMGVLIGAIWRWSEMRFSELSGWWAFVVVVAVGISVFVVEWVREVMQL